MVHSKCDLRTSILHAIFRDTSVLGNFVAAVPDLLPDCGEEEVENLSSEAKLFYSLRIKKKYPLRIFTVTHDVVI